MRNVQLLVLSMCFLSVNFAFASTTASASADQWNQLVNETVQKGTDAVYGDSDWKILARVVPGDTSKPRQADYFSTIGGVGPDGKYLASAVSVVSENWQITNGNWDVDQRIYNLTINGDLIQVNHNHLMEKMDGTVIGDDSLPVGKITDADVLAEWNKKLAEWYAVLPDVSK
jgi:hypothetical protein